MSGWQRTHTCGELREAHVGQTVTMCGWVNTCRAQQHQAFLDLRDRHGLTQIVFENEKDADLFTRASAIQSEWVLPVTGAVRNRLPGKDNPELAPGKSEELAT